MHILVNRCESDSKATRSEVSVDGTFVCYAVEDEARDIKVEGETRIPAGTYKVGVRKVGGFHAKYAKLFDFHRGMLHVQNVPNFEHILIHVGNSEKDSAGCLCVGLAKGPDMTVLQSRMGYKKLYMMVIRSAEAGTLTIEYQDNDKTPEKKDASNPA